MLGIEAMREIAKFRGGKCLSNEYTTAHSKLQWKCSRAHIWEMKPASIQQGQWCPECSSARNERICKKMFEAISKKRFIKTRPKWLMSKSNRPLELDGYCKELNLAFEYQGVQHYPLKRNFFGSYNNNSVLERDRLKRDLCKKHDVVLIEIPYYIKLDELQDYIVKRCKELRIGIPTGIGEIDYRTFDVYSDENIGELKLIAEKNGGKCLSKYYLGIFIPLLWKCKKGHQWEAPPTQIKQGYWCPKCSSRPVLGIQDMRAIALSRGGKCLSAQYLDARTKLRWQCAEGHIWETTPGSIRGGHWCPKCSNKIIAEKIRKYSIADMNRLASKKGGKCLSDEFISIHSPLKWVCVKEHIWSAQPSNIMRGSWCPYCSLRVKRTIQDMMNFAKTKKGKCLSSVYANNKTKLKWQCERGHNWEATPNNILRGQWCPFCFKNS
ncbi:MAG: hypothetical protein IPN70_01215 [Candidatus Moraniibacteriota bacterium]|nr:MAG: hypothetical protein IPN70_01215 [Candidatus Moranbacteria bacterium]